MNSIAVSLLAAAIALSPSKSPDRLPAVPVMAAATASATIVPAARTDLCGTAAGTVVQPAGAGRGCPRLVVRIGSDGELRHDLELQ